MVLVAEGSSNPRASDVTDDRDGFRALGRALVHGMPEDEQARLLAKLDEYLAGEHDGTGNEERQRA
jgi:hypothetical protein